MLEVVVSIAMCAITLGIIYYHFKPSSKKSGKEVADNSPGVVSDPKTKGTTGTAGESKAESKATNSAPKATSPTKPDPKTIPRSPHTSPNSAKSKSTTTEPKDHTIKIAIKDNVCTLITDYSSITIYQAFINTKVQNFVKKYLFVNANFNHDIEKKSLTIILHGQAAKQKYRYTTTWEDINCTPYKENPDIKTIDCFHKLDHNDYNKKQKIFWYKKAENLKDYIEKLKNNIISEEAHTQYFGLILEAFENEKTFYNHNTDIGILHIKLNNDM